MYFRSIKLALSFLFFFSCLFFVSNTTSAATSRWIAGGYGTNTLAYSDDGINWQPVPNSTSIFFKQGYKTAYNGNIFVSTGGGIGSVNSIAYSTDGINWTPTAKMVDMFSAIGSAVAWNGSRWVALGQGTNNTIAYSDDGVHWTPATNSTSIFSTNGNTVIWTGTRWLASGNGTNALAYSNDGITWTPVTNSTSIFSVGRGLACNNTRCVAGGTGNITGNTLAYSDDGGLTWIPEGKAIFATTVFGIAWNGTRFVAVGGSTNSIAYSDDGINWTPVVNSTSIFSGYGRDISWNGTRFVAVGNGTNSIAYSDDGITWTPVTNSTSIFSINGNSVMSAPAPNLIPPTSGIMIDAPGSLSATPDLKSVSLSWTTPIDNGGRTITDYEVKYRTGSNPFATFAHIPSTATTINITGLNPNTAYDFTVAAVDVDGVGRVSSVSSTTLNDTVPPVLTILGSNPISINRGQTYTDPGATANDDHAGDVTSAIITTNPVNTNIAGDYTVSYSVSDTVGNTSTATRTVHVLDYAPILVQSSATGIGLLPIAYQAPQTTFSTSNNSSASLGFTITPPSNSSSNTITLNFTAGPDVKRLAISEDPSFQFASQEDYIPTKAYTFSSSATGKKTIYVRFYTAYGQSSQTFEKSLDMSENKVSPFSSFTPATLTSTSSAPITTPPVTGQQMTIVSDEAITRTLINNLKLGMNNSSVKQLQSLLKKQGFFSYPTITGYYGVITKKAVEKFLSSIR